MRRYFQTAVLWLAAVSAGGLINPAHGEMVGDEEAIALANQMIESIGGKALWSSGRSLYVIEKSRTPRGGGTMGTFWRDLQVPRERYRLDTRRGNVIEFWWDHRGVYQTVNGALRMEGLPDNIRQLVKDYWPGEVYVLFHRIASEDSLLRYENGSEPGQFRVINSKTGDLRGTFWVNGDGEMYRWRHFDEENPVEYVYGPLRNFGAISFPSWGAQVDGSWMFEYVEVRLSEEAFGISFDAPE